MYHTIEEFLTDWSHESKSTLRLLKNLDDTSLNKKVHANVRTVGFLAWHIIHSLSEMPAKTGLHTDLPDHEDYHGESAAQLVAYYEKGAASLAEEVRKNWTDADLKKEDNMYGQMWNRATTLQILVRHQAHHRAELLVLMRMLGLPVVGVYGPTKEEWTQFGMQPMN
jgi:uncharacterized damage-inducible protein DinB